MGWRRTSTQRPVKWLPLVVPNIFLVSRRSRTANAPRRVTRAHLAETLTEGDGSADHIRTTEQPASP